jgi:hypothetical protein
MRRILISIYPRPNAINKNGAPDNSYMYNSQDIVNPNSTYEFNSMMLNYSLQSSAVTSTLILGMNEPQSLSNVLRSGQPVEIIDNGDIVFQGVILAPRYKLLPMSEDSRGGLYVFITLAPSIYQLTSTPMIFDANQAKQVSELTGINVQNLLAGEVAQNATSASFINYMISNTDYKSFFGHEINVYDLSSNVFVMADAGQSRDSVLRSSIDFNNVVLYQSENGIIYIRQLDSTIAAPFNLDLSNQFNDSDINTTTPTVPLLDYEYFENAASTPSVVSNYNMLPPNLGIANSVAANILSYMPNPEFFPRVSQLAKTGWFVGEIGQTQINNNIITDPTVAKVISGYDAQIDKYMIRSPQIGAANQSTVSYQTLLTGKQLGQALVNYAILEGTISLDDRNISIQQNMGSVLGTIIKMQNCDMESGIIATCSRNYSSSGSYLTFSIAPLGSITGYWRA